MLGPHTAMVIFKLLVGVKWDSYEIVGDSVLSIGAERTVVCLDNYSGKERLQERQT